MFGQIYLVTNKANGKRYVGQTTGTVPRRWRAHVRDSEKGLDSHFCRAIRKYTPEGFTVEAVADAPDQDTLNAFEYFYVKYLDTIEPNKGYNKREGGGQTAKHGKELSLRMSNARKGRIITPEWRAKIGAAMGGEKNPFYGKKHTEETLVKMRKPKSPEYCQKMSKMRKGPGGPKYRHDVSTERLIELYNSGLGTYRIGKMVGMANCSVWNRLHAAGVATRSSAWRRSTDAGQS